MINAGKDAKTKEGKEPKSDKEKEEFERRMEEAEDPAEMFDLLIEERKEAHIEVRSRPHIQPILYPTDPTHL